MSTNRARMLLGASVVLLILIGLVWARDSNHDPRADLTGEVVVATTTSTTAPPTTTTSVPPRPATTLAPTRLPPAPVVELPDVASNPPPAPERLSIPALGVDTTVVPVGLESDGSMEIPGVSQAGWYLHGRRPGEPFGSAVIAAHVDYGGAPGVFFDLRILDLGAQLSVTAESGRVVRYVVTERFQVDKEALPVDELFRLKGAPTLTLITCGGAFDAAARHYTDNIVIRAVPA